MAGAFQSSGFQNSGFQTGVIAPSIVGGSYSRIPLYRHRKKHLEEELEQLAHQLRDIAIDIPLPGHSEPVIYDEPLFEAFSDKQKTINILVSRRAKVEAEYQALLKRQQEDDDDDESAILLLWQ